MFENAPKSYKDPFWRGLAETVEAEVGIPSGLLQNVLLKGERSNADQVSSAGARTPFQIIPQTREAVQKKYGIDAYASPENSAKAAALLLKESLDRNNGSAMRAVQEYHGGTDPKNYGPVNAAYTKRVLGDMEQQTSRVDELDRMIKDRLSKSAPASEQPSRVDELDQLIKAKMQKTAPSPAVTREALIAQIPGVPSYNPEPKKPAPSPLERIMGGLEAGASMVASAAAFPVAIASGALGGAIGGIVPGGPSATEGALTGFNSVMSAVSPTTEQGKRSLESIGRFITDDLKIPAISPIAGIGPVGAIQNSMRNVPAVKNMVQQSMGRTKPVTAPIGAQVQNGGFTAEQITPTVTSRPGIVDNQQIANVGKMVNKAASSGLGSTKAKENLAQAARLNPDAIAAAKRLDIELPADVFSDNPQVVASAGLTRSAAGSDAEGAWRTSVINAADRADEVMNGLDASTDVASMSDNVRSKLLTTRKGLADSAKMIYDEVDTAVPKSSKVELNALKSYVDNLVGEVGEGGLNSAEKRLKNLLESGEPITYARLIREKNILGDKMKGVGPLEGDLDSASVKRLYGALATDQLDNVGQIGGAELQTKLKGANALYAKERALSKRIVNAYGSETDGSIATLMGRAVKSAQKGDDRDLTKLLKVVPKELQAEVLASSIMANTRSRAGNSLVKGGFGFSEFTDFYRGLRQNEPVYNRMVQVLGKEKTDVMRDMYEVSKRVTAARANVLTTGKANQALVESMTAEGIMGGMINAANTGIGRATTTGSFAAFFGPTGAAAAQLGIDFLAKARPDRIKAAGKLFTDERFQQLMVDIATEPKNPKIKNQVKAVVRSPNFRVFANKINLPPQSYEAFMLAAIQAQEEK